jgi:Ca2+:H+ antiporter
MRGETGSMNEQKIAAPRKAPRTAAARPAARHIIVGEAPALAGILTTLIFFAFGSTMLSNLQSNTLAIVLFVWLFGIMMWCSFGVVRHAEALAENLGEPYGTLVLTFR